MNSRPLRSCLITATVIRRVRSEGDPTNERVSLATYQAGSTPFSVSDYFWQQAERAELSPKNAYDQWRAAIGWSCTTWTTYGGGSRSRLGIHGGTVSCLRSGWPVAASELSPQGKLTSCNPRDCPRRCRSARVSRKATNRSVFFRRKPGEPSDKRKKWKTRDFFFQEWVVALAMLFQARIVEKFPRLSVSETSGCKILFKVVTIDSPETPETVTDRRSSTSNRSSWKWRGVESDGRELFPRL